MLGVEWQMFALVGFVLAIVMGSIFLLRARRMITTILMLIASVSQVLGMGVMIAARILMSSGMSSMGTFPNIERYRVLMDIGGVMFMGGLVLFAYGFVKFSLRQMALERRAEELEGMVKGFSERLGGER